MAKNQGIYLPLSPARKVVWDLLESTRRIPQATVSRRMNLHDLFEARRRALPRPSWNSIFTKGYARVAAATPELRRTFVRRPWARLYEHSDNVAAIAIEVDMAGEKAIIAGKIQNPEKLDLIALDQAVVATKNDPARAKWTRRAMRVTWLPRWVRGLVWSLVLDWSGYRQARVLGTFGVTSIAFAGGHDAIPLITLANVLHYGIVESDGTAWVRLTFDHRILDGALAARSLVKLEQALNTDILAELSKLHARAAA
jgi:hypothetical protein